MSLSRTMAQVESGGGHFELEVGLLAAEEAGFAGVVEVGQVVDDALDAEALLEFGLESDGKRGRPRPGGGRRRGRPCGGWSVLAPRASRPKVEPDRFNL